MRIVRAVIFLLLICSFGCDKSDQIYQQPFSLTMSRSQCYGTCPVYWLKVESNGKVEFEGIRFTQTIGKAESRLSDEKVKELIEEIKKANIFSLKDDYTPQSKNCTSVATDGPGASLSIKFGETEKSINHSSNCIVQGRFSDEAGLKRLANLEKRIDEIVETKRWIGEGK